MPAGRPSKKETVNINSQQTSIDNKEPMNETPNATDSIDSYRESPDVTSITLVRIPELSDKPTYRVSEVAQYYSVTERTVYSWIERGYLETVLTPLGQWRITRDSLNKARFAGKEQKEDESSK